MDQIKHYITRVTTLTALSVWRLIQEKGFTPQDFLTEGESKAREILIDQAGVDAMSAALTDIPFVLEVVGSEGRKHLHQYGEALPTLMGTFGTGTHKLDMVNDVVEGSKAAKMNTPGAVSVIAVGSHQGLLATPEDTDYMDKLFGPPELKRRISLGKPIAENLAEAVKTFKVKPSEINVVVQERDRNAHYINACQKSGVNLILIKAGDFLPSVLACLSPKTHKKGIYLVCTIGGFEEGVMAAVAAKALGAVGEGKGWSADLQIQKKYQKIWKLDDLVSGKKSDCLVSISSVTGDDKWFDLAPLATLTVSEDGVKIEKKIHH